MTRITVVGGTGYAGSTIAREAAGRGHEVVALSRSQPSEPIEGVSYVQGTATEAAADLIKDADVVVAALSPRGDNVGQLVATYSALGEAAAEAGARLIAIGGFGAMRPAPGAPRFAEGDAIPADYRAEALEMNEVREALVTTASEDLDWVYVSPAAGYRGDIPGEALGNYRIGGDVALFDEAGESNISGADFALAVVDEIESPKHRREHISVAY